MKIHREKFKTLNDVFDEFTERNLFTLSSQGHFAELQSPIALGKEANIFTALKDDGTSVIVKIYRLSTSDFTKMFAYMREDPRFVNVKQNRREIIFAWAKREYLNLMKARNAGVSVPTPYTNLFNILVMECIGEPAPKLKDMPPQHRTRFLNETLDNCRKLYKAGLIHGDLSAFNILNDNEHPVFIDMSQSTTLENPHAETYLKRDIKNTLDFFRKHKSLMNDEEALEYIKRS